MPENLTKCNAWGTISQSFLSTNPPILHIC